jgi:hypothetical protein
MRKQIIFLFFLVFPSILLAQSSKKIVLGFNFQPVLCNSYEVIGEYKLEDHVATFGKLGYAGNASFLRINNKDLENDEIKDISTSGSFIKLGLKYTFDSRIFILGNFLLSDYKNSVTYTPYFHNSPITFDVTTIKYSGIYSGLSIGSGYRAHLIKDHLFFDMGMQLTYVFNNSRQVGSGLYVPGAGSLIGYYPIYFQGIMGLMVVF